MLQAVFLQAQFSVSLKKCLPLKIDKVLFLKNSDGHVDIVGIDFYPPLDHF